MGTIVAPIIAVPSRLGGQVAPLLDNILAICRLDIVSHALASFFCYHLVHIHLRALSLSCYPAMWLRYLVIVLLVIVL